MQAAQDIGAQPLPGITYAARGDTTPEAEVSAPKNIYRFVLDCRAKKEAAPESRPDAAKGPKHDSRQQRYRG
jgi:hypothetical protein